MASLNRIEAIVFDVFGTLVDWYSSISEAGRELGIRTGLEADWNKLALEWRAGYAPALARVNAGEAEWATLDVLHAEILEELLPRYGLEGLSAEDRKHFNMAWHRLRAWPDVGEGLSALRPGFLLAPLSNGNVSQLVDLGRHNDWRWDCVFSCELAGRYKPDSEVYLTATRLLGLEPDRVLMVAAHANDLKGARSAGLRTAYVHRPHEFGPRRCDGEKILAGARQEGFDAYADDLPGLARQLSG